MDAAVLGLNLVTQFIVRLDNPTFGCLVNEIYFSRWRIFFGALFASMIIPLSIGLGIDWLFHPLAKLIYSIGIVWIAFSYRQLKTLVTQWISFYIVNFSIGVESTVFMHFGWNRTFS